MRKTLQTKDLVKVLQEARRLIEIHSMPQYSPNQAGGAIFALGLIVGLLKKRLEIKQGSKEDINYLKKVWGKPSKQVKKESDEYVDELRRKANLACTCNDGNTSCQACTAKEELVRLWNLGIHIFTPGYARGQKSKSPAAISPLEN